MNQPAPVSTNAAAPGDDDQPHFPPDLFSASQWSLKDLKHIQEIGKGKDTIIYSATCPRLGGRVAAVKVYDKAKVAPTKLRAIKREIAMMMFLQRKKVPNVVEFYGAFEDENYYYIVMEYCPGGDLLEYLLRDRKAMSERRCAADVAAPLLATLARLHELNVIHRDIKLENIFLDASGRVRLGDFGLTMSLRQESAISPVGTVEYMAPEVVALPSVDHVTSGRVRASSIPPTNEKVDIWALGVTLYELVTGRLPFEGRDKAEIKESITSYRLAAFPLCVSAQCQGMIRGMLSYEAAARPSAVELLRHPFLATHAARAPPVGGTVTLEVRAGPGPLVSPKNPPAMAVAAAGGPSGSGSPHSTDSPSGKIPAVMGTGFQESAPSQTANRGGKGGSQAWAALRRISGGHISKPPAEKEKEPVESSGGVKNAVKRLFSRHSAPHAALGVNASAAGACPDAQPTALQWG